MLKALPETRSFTQDGGTLALLDSSGTASLTYKHLGPSALVGPKWDVTGLNTGNAVSSPIIGTTLTATFARVVFASTISAPSVSGTLKLNKPVFGLKTWDIDGVVICENPDDAVLRAARAAHPSPLYHTRQAGEGPL